MWATAARTNFWLWISFPIVLFTDFIFDWTIFIMNNTISEEKRHAIMRKCVTEYVAMPLRVSQSAELCLLLACERPFEDCPLICNHELPTSPVNMFTCEIFQKHNFHSLLLPLSYRNGMWNPNSCLQRNAWTPTWACAKNLLHFCFCSVQWNPFCTICSQYYTFV